MENNSLVVLNPQGNITEFESQRNVVLDLVRGQMVVGQDYGIIPGTETKTLLQPGAEKLAKFFGIGPKFELLKELEDLETGFFYYRYRCTLIHLATGREVGNIERSCNSGEKKYAFNVVSEKYATEDQISRKVERFQNKKGYWMIRVKKTLAEVLDDVNTIQSMAQKRAFVAAVRTATMATDLFSEDIPDSPTGPTTKVDDPARVKLISKFWTAAKPRGFTDEIIHRILAKHYDVDSLTKLTNEQLVQMTEKILTEYARVEPGQRIKKIEDIKN